MLNILKIGSASLFDEHKRINYPVLRKKAQEIETSDDDYVLIVSGAIALGKIMEGETRSNDELSSAELQGYASVGQVELMNIYQKVFTKHISQLLITEEDLIHENHVKDLIENNCRRKRKTLINYNDGVDFNQLRKDNDTLGSQILNLTNADRLIILGHYDGFVDQSGKLIKSIERIDDSTYEMCNGKSSTGTGGFKTKLDAAKMCMDSGKEMIVSNINYNVNDIIAGTVPRTLFRKF